MLTLEEFKAESLKDPDLNREYDTQAEEFRQISEKIRTAREGSNHHRQKPSLRPSPLKPSLA